MSREAHWQTVYSAKEADEVSWYRPRLDMSLELIRATGLTKSGRIIDIGAGASTLVDDLLAAGYECITALDISETALNIARQRLGSAAKEVTWIVGDVTEVDLGEKAFDLWHDRAALHFLTDAADRTRYADALSRALAPGGHAVLSAFSPDGPEQCSGLDIRQYDAPGLTELLGDDFQMRECRTEIHTTPSGNEVPFTYCRLQKTAAAG